jgi:hypothetical protein
MSAQRKLHHGESALTLSSFAKGFSAPISASSYPGDEAGTLCIADQVGVVYRVGGERGSTATVVLDVTSRLVKLNEGYDERGLLDFAFSPGGEWLYVTYSAPLGSAGHAKRGGSDAREAPRYEDRLSRFVVSREGKVLSADPDSEEVLLRIGPKVWPHHEGCRIAFGPDSYLYMTVGDGGPAQRDPERRGQDLGVLYGKVLRLDVSRGGAERGYIPATNPFRRGDSANGVQREEIWAYGFRNPWGISFDRQGRCIVVDVGLDEREEVNVVVRGGNYGWSALEGTRKAGFDVLRFAPGTPSDERVSVDPVWEYKHSWMQRLVGKGASGKGGVAIVGGYVVEGKGYVCGDYAGALMIVGGSSGTSEGESWKLDMAATLPGLHVRALGRSEGGRIFVLTSTAAGIEAGAGEVYELML